MIELIHGDCLIENERIANNIVDLILTDLPYGTIKGLPIDGYKNTEWDNAIPPIQVFNIANRILRKNGKLALFSQEPYTSKLITSAIPNLPFNYRMIWKKDHFANGLIAKKAPVNYYEDIVIFNKMYETEFNHPLREYFRNVLLFINLPKSQIFKQLGTCLDHVFRIESTQFDLCSEKAYQSLIDAYKINEMEEFMEYEELVNIDSKFISTFNLWEGNKIKSNVLEYKKDYDGHHPTQKPILLLEDLIKTFSNENDLVVDLTMGSGSTGVACKNTNRNFIGIELDKSFFDIATKRIESKNKSKSLF